MYVVCRVRVLSCCLSAFAWSDLTGLRFAVGCVVVQIRSINRFNEICYITHRTRSICEIY